ncbi:hypothetical protein [Desulfovibrio sp. 1214_IL3152]
MPEGRAGGTSGQQEQKTVTFPEKHAKRALPQQCGKALSVPARANDKT